MQIPAFGYFPTPREKARWCIPILVGQQGTGSGLKMANLLQVILGLVTLHFVGTGLLLHVQSAPVEIPPFETCQTAHYAPIPGAGPQPSTFACCPPLSERPIVDFIAPSVKPGHVNVRRPIQCADDDYLDKLEKAYGLMRDLPDDDPRSLYQQTIVHCAYCGGAFFQPGTNNSIDIHYTWLFFPWHRAFLYFHEKILQSLLNDATFTLPYWNWDEQLGASDGDTSSPEDQCFKSGNTFPRPYLSSETHNRSSLIVHRVMLLTDTPAETIVDLANLFRNRSVPLNGPGSYNKSVAYQVASNLNLMHRTLVKSATTADTFFGAPYRVGDPQSAPNFDPPQIYGGSIEMGPHFNLHAWSGPQERPNPEARGLWNTASDPVFYANHANVDRLWVVWKSLGGRRKDIDDPDWLNASFLFYNENKDLVRIKIADVLSTEKLGYTYEKVVDSWISYDNSPICSELSPSRFASTESGLAMPLAPSGITLDLNTSSYSMLVERPEEALIFSDVEETLVIRGIKIDKNLAAQFLVFLNLPDAQSNTPWNCAEFVGRFSFMPMGGGVERDISHKKFSFRADITGILRDLEIEASPRVIITVVYNSVGLNNVTDDQLPVIFFNSATIELSS